MVVRDHYYFLTKACILLGGRITVVVDPSVNEGEKIMAAAAWYPPHKRLAAWMVPTIVKSGALSVLWRWGSEGFNVSNSISSRVNVNINFFFGILKRINFGYHDTCEKAYKKFYAENCWADSPHDSWYLQYTYTIPEHQGKGETSF